MWKEYQQCEYFEITFIEKYETRLGCQNSDHRRIRSDFAKIKNEFVAN